MKEEKTIGKIRALVDELKADTDLLTQLSTGEEAEQVKRYRSQVEVVKGKLNELMKLTMALHVESLVDRVREYGPKADEQVEAFGEKISEFFKSLVEGFGEPFRTKKEEEQKPSGGVSGAQAQALYEEYRNLINAGFSEAQAFEIIRARSASSS